MLHHNALDARGYEASDSNFPFLWGPKKDHTRLCPSLVMAVSFLRVVGRCLALHYPQHPLGLWGRGLVFPYIPSYLDTV